MTFVSHKFFLNVPQNIFSKEYDGRCLINMSLLQLFDYQGNEPFNWNAVGNNGFENLIGITIIHLELFNLINSNSKFNFTLQYQLIIVIDRILYFFYLHLFGSLPQLVSESQNITIQAVTRIYSGGFLNTFPNHLSLLSLIVFRMVFRMTSLSYNVVPLPVTLLSQIHDVSVT